LNRAQKESFVTDLTEGLSTAQSFALLSFASLTVEQMTSFRLSLRKQNVRVKVVKNTLAKKVFATTPYKDMGTHLTGPTLVAYSEGDPVAAAKAIFEWVGKENFKINVKGGAALGQSMTEAQIKALSKLPGKKELLTGFLWALNSPATQFLYALQDTPRKLGYALGALKAKKEEESK